MRSFVPDSLREDVRFSLRMLRRNRGFAIAAVLTVALGIDATTAVFNVVNAVVMRPLRFPDPQRLMVILSAQEGVRGAFPSAQGVYLDWCECTTMFEAIAGARVTRNILTGMEQARQMSAGAVSYDFFPLIGAKPVLGRTFEQSEA